MILPKQRTMLARQQVASSTDGLKTSELRITLLILPTQSYIVRFWMIVMSWAYENSLRVSKWCIQYLFYKFACPFLRHTDNFRAQQWHGRVFYQRGICNAGLLFSMGHQDRHYHSNDRYGQCDQCLFHGSNSNFYVLWLYCCWWRGAYNIFFYIFPFMKRKIHEELIFLWIPSLPSQAMIWI
jgi:hypothetical protein